MSDSATAVVSPSAPPVLWRPPAPTIGGKKRDCHFVAARLTTWQPDFIVDPLCRWSGGLSAYAWQSDWQRLVLADCDPAVRAVWQAADAGRLDVAALGADSLWRSFLRGHANKPDDRGLSRQAKSRGEGRVSGPWCELRRVEHTLCNQLRDTDLAYDVDAHAAAAIALSAGSNQGGWRRAANGAHNFPYSPSYDPEFLTSRIPDLRPASAWASGRVASIDADWREALDRAGVALGRGKTVVLLIDPPYGNEAGSLYGRGWNRECLNALAAEVLKLVAAGAKAIVWCGPDDLDAYHPGIVLCGNETTIGELGFWWNKRPTKTLIKAERRDPATGEVIEPARYGSGGWIGHTAGIADEVASWAVAARVRKTGRAKAKLT